LNTQISNSLDRIAISMAVICGIHCLVTPVLLVALPILATTFWVDENFHLWMILLVIPTTSLALWSGCRRHKDKWVLAAGAMGLGILVMAIMAERVSKANGQYQIIESGFQIATHKEKPGSSAHAAKGGCCPLHPAEGASSEKSDAVKTKSASFPGYVLLNMLGGLTLAAGHTRNFLLCRKRNCSHEDDCS
jgi:hypothetical protein